MLVALAMLIVMMVGQIAIVLLVNGWQGSVGEAIKQAQARSAQARAAQQDGNRLPWGTGSTASAGGGTGGQIAKLERLQKLRESGALTDSEFQREKAKIRSES